MGVYIGMEMPQNCDECPLNSTCGYSLHMPLYHTEKRHDDCPLIEVPEPHGRLGDLDELARKIEHDRYHHTHTDGLAARHHIAEYGHFLKEIADTPTVIPASEEE